MNTSTKILLGAVFVLCLCLFCAIDKYISQKDEAERQAANVEALTEAKKCYIIQDSVRVSEISSLTLTKKEFEKLCKTQAAQIKALEKANGKIKPSSFTETTKTDTFILTKLDTVIIRGDTCTAYNDRYINFLYCNDTAYFETNDTIRQVISRAYKHKFLFWRFGDAGIKQQIWSTNPHSNLIFDKFVEIK